MTLHNFARPTLGFETRRAAILHLHAQGAGVHVIAHDCGSTVGSVKVHLAKAKLTPREQSTHRQGGRPVFIELSPDAVAALRPHAARRGLGCAALAALIVDTVAQAGLVDAILDDREG